MERFSKSLSKGGRLEAYSLSRLVVTVALLRIGVCLEESSCNLSRLAKFPGGWPKTLDSHIYWFSAQDEAERATGTASQFYDPTKSTIIFIQGWNGAGNGGVAKCRRWTSSCTPDVCPDQRILASSWVEKGWNFGIFYWDQFADEACARDAETKIWLATSDGSLTWKSYDAQKAVEEIKVIKDYPSVAHICAQAVRSAMETWEGPTLRLAGHSFGAQMAAHCGKLLHEQTPYHPARPSRIVLLDPFFSIRHFGIFRCSKVKFTQGYGRLFPELVMEAVKELWQRGVVTELYKGSLLTLEGIYGDAAPELETLATFVHQTPLFCERKEFKCAHCSLLPLYLLRIDDNQPYVEWGSPEGSCTVPGPACTDGEMKQFIQRQNTLIAEKGQRQVWLQISGGLTIETSDDSYRYETEPVPTNTSLLGLDVQPTHAGSRFEERLAKLREVIPEHEVPEQSTTSVLGRYLPSLIFISVVVLFMCCVCSIIVAVCARSSRTISGSFLPLSLEVTEDVHECDEELSSPVSNP